MIDENTIYILVSSDKYFIVAKYDESECQVQAIYDRLQDRFFGPQVNQAARRKDLDFDHSTPRRSFLPEYSYRGPLAVGMQGSLVVGLGRDVSAKTKTYRREINRAKRNCASLQGTSSKKQVKAEQASKAPHEYGKHLSHPRSVFRIPGTASRCLSVELGFRMSIVSGIPDS